MKRQISRNKLKRSFAVILALMLVLPIMPMAAASAGTLATPVLIQKGAPTDTPGSAGNPASHTQYRSLIFNIIDGATGYNVYAYATKADAEKDTNRVAESLNAQETVQSASTGGTMSQSPMALEDGEMLIDIRLIQFTDVKEGATRTLPDGYTPAGLGDTYYPGPAGSGDKTNLKPGQYWFRVQAVDSAAPAKNSKLSDIYEDGDAFSIAAGPNEARDLIEIQLNEKGLPGSEPNASWYLVDLRGPFEHSDEGVIRFSESTRKTPGDFNTTEKAEAIFGTNKAVPIFVFCRGGGRAVTAARHLSNAGYTNVTNVQGVNQWTNGLLYDDPTFRFTAVPAEDVAKLVDVVTKDPSDKDGAIGPAPTPGQPHTVTGIAYDVAAKALRWYNIPRAKFDIYAFSSITETDTSKAVAKGTLDAIDLLVDGSGADWRLARKFDLAKLNLKDGTYYFRVQALPEVELPVRDYEPATIWGAPSELSGAVVVTLGTVTAKPTSSKVLVDGKEITFEAYNINDNNYFKLRDIANILNGTDKQFEVSWDGEAGAIYMTSGESYTPVGGEMTGKGAGNKAATQTLAKIYLDDVNALITTYHIEGNNYFMLRNLGEALDFGVTWGGTNNTISIDTTKGYAAD